ncbi:uncharacterized protein LOC142166102 [Nicotiana tabacum]|uniref:Uncharacterized protein LOC142166102 n=1 Tax=Nicotiana tabacum TaxID=4097 RepID=A0AC58S6K9_TOBAC
MSPYLFVLAIEYLNRSLKTLIQNPDFNFHPKCTRLQVLHIRFVDDLLMCCRADEVFMKLMMRAFDHFSTVFELQANLEKSLLYIAGVHMDFKDKMLAKLHLTIGKLPFKYLGVPLYTRKLSIHQCMPLVEKIIDKIRSWTSKFLPYAGRLQLINSLLFEMQIYWEQETLCKPRAVGGVNIINYEIWNKDALTKLHRL